MNKRGALIRKQNEIIEEMRQNEIKQKRENMIDIDLGRFYDIATTNKIYVNRLNLQVVRIDILGDYTVDFEMIE